MEAGGGIKNKQMKIHVFGGLKDYFTSEFDLTGIVRNTDELKAALLVINGQAGPLLSACRFAIADGFIDNEFKLNENDIIVVIPPSSGG